MITEGTGAVSCWIAVTFEQSGIGHCGAKKEGGEQEDLKKSGRHALRGRGQSVQNRVCFRPGLELTPAILSSTTLSTKRQESLITKGKVSIVRLCYGTRVQKELSHNVWTVSYVPIIPQNTNTH